MGTPEAERRRLAPAPPPNDPYTHEQDKPQVAALQAHDLCNVFLTVPDPFTSSEAAHRFAHDDLPGLDDARLWQEFERCRMRLALESLGTPEAAWVAERLRRSQAEQARRRRGGR